MLALTGERCGPWASCYILVCQLHYSVVPNMCQMFTGPHVRKTYLAIINKVRQPKKRCRVMVIVHCNCAH